MPVALGNADPTAAPTDWWFLYKTPKDVGPGGDSTGYENVYFDGSTTTVALSAHTLDHPGSCLQQTLAQIFGDDPNVGYILWNDEVPEDVPKDFRFTAARDSTSYGHTKGVLGFDKTKGTAFYLVHSTPKFPAVGDPLIPNGQNNNGQTFLCVTLSYAAANDVAEVLRLHHRPQVYASKLPGVQDDESLAQLATCTKFPAASKVPAAVDLRSGQGAAFRFFGKSKAWSAATDGGDGRDFWSDLVGPSLRVNLDVETWRDGSPPVFSDVDVDPSSGQTDGLTTQDVLEVNLGNVGIAGWRWLFGKDHAKWGIATSGTDGWVIVADLNRQASQANRGGGGMAFQHAGLWKVLFTIQVPETTVETGLHTDAAPKD